MVDRLEWPPDPLHAGRARHDPDRVQRRSGDGDAERSEPWLRADGVDGRLRGRLREVQQHGGGGVLMRRAIPLVMALVLCACEPQPSAVQPTHAAVAITPPSTPTPTPPPKPAPALAGGKGGAPASSRGVLAVSGV